ncbi:MAG: hypothetical protein N3F64_04445 [Nitrososphaeria archaeon]|nr:hypothetical protein [Nitrososphaeria archaeon]
MMHMSSTGEKKFKGWIVSLDKNKSPISETVLYFNAARELNTVTGKILPFSWIKSLNTALNKFSNYHLSKCINKIVSPDGEDMTEYMIFAVLASKKESIKSYSDNLYNIPPSDIQLYSKAGLLISVSEDNQVGLFGLRPYELFNSVASKPVRAKVLESLVVNRPDFWEEVHILVTADYDWSKIFYSSR